MITFALQLRTQPGDTVPPEVRLRSALKRPLRDHRLTCTDVRAIGVTTTLAAAADATDDDALPTGEAK